MNDEQLGIQPDEEKREVEGHVRVPVRDDSSADDTTDVEGHKRASVREAPDDDDVEGHVRTTGGRG
jgi:hypothetical protein